VVKTLLITDKDIQREMNLYIKNIQKRCEQILREEIEKLVYDSYTPEVYERTFSLLEAVDSKITNDGSLLVYINEGALDYYSVVDGSNQSKNVPFYLNYGHEDATGIDNMYHNYPSRNFIESSAKRISNEFGIKVEIINDRNIGYLDNYR
jgi:hypothetical protein